MYSSVKARVLFSCGLNDDGQCGIEPNLSDQEDSEESISIPTIVQFPTQINVASVSCGSRHTLALTDRYCVYSWGWGQQGQLGLGHYEAAHLPSKIDFSDNNIVNISAGGIHSACIDSSGYCYTWGSASYGQLGLGEDIIKEGMCHTPRRIHHLAPDHTGGVKPFRAMQISCGGMHTAAVEDDGSVWCWGRADSGQTGCQTWIFTCYRGVAVPTRLTSLPPEESAASVSCGGFHTLVLTRTGRVYSMGRDDFGLLGTGSREGLFSAGAEKPLLVTSLSDQRVSRICCGGWHNLFLTEQGEVYACGKGEYGRLGGSDESSRDEPVLVAPSPSPVTAASSKIEEKSPHSQCSKSLVITEMSAGGSHSLLLTSSQEVWVTGRTDFGRLGLGQHTRGRDRVLQPERLDLSFLSDRGKARVVQVAAGGSHSMFVVEL